MLFADVLEIKNGRNQRAVENPNGAYPIYGSGGVMGYADDFICQAQTVVVGRSLVIGRPVALMLIARDATVTVCHTKTVDLPGECRNADIIVACCGVAKAIGADHLKAGQIVIDVGMNVDEDGKLCGDVDYDKAAEIAEAVTPVPGGVGSVTTSVLLKHVVDSCAGA